MIQRGNNADRHLCQKCRYKAKGAGCDYFAITDKPRPCDPKDCFLWADDPETQTDPVKPERKNIDIRIYENIANAVVERAANDYIESGIKIFKISMKQNITREDENEIYKRERMISECERFFRSDWFAELTDVNGKALIDALDRRITKTIAEMREKNEKRKV